MTLDGARIYNEGVGISQDCEEKIRQIVAAIKTLSPSSEVSMKFLKSGTTYEGLLWGNASDIPIGVYNRGQSMTHVLDTIYRKVKKECLKVWKVKGVGVKSKARSQYRSHSPIAMVG
jgi:hypothetical protein